MEPTTVLADVSILSDPLYKQVASTAAGLFLHILKKKLEYRISIKDYILQHGERTVLSMVTVVGTFAAMQSVNVGLLEFFMLGYMCDSLVNKAPTCKQKEATPTARS